MADLFPVWNQVEGLLNSGFSLIPVRDKQDGNFAAKVPYARWKKYQSEIITKEDLWADMDRHGTAAVSIICGKVSGYLEAIDIDVKHFPGIDANIFSAIHTMYPELWEKLRIHKTPSGGYHILYRIADAPNGVPGNDKLAKRPSTEEELQTKKEKTKCFIETRGEGGYILAPPSLGYSVHKPDLVPVISWNDRESLINICRSFDTVPVIIKPPKATSYDTGYYDQDPFTHFNHSQAGEQVLLQAGWVLDRDTTDFLWFGKPGSKRGSVHATFIKDRRLFYFWTTNTDFESNRCYNPATLLGQLNFAGDYKKLYRWLVDQGYGVISSNRESDLIKRRALDNKPLPANLSQHARYEFEQVRAEVVEKYPYGVFWMQEDEGGYTISRERFYQVSTGLGFRWYRSGIVHIVGQFIHKVDERAFFDVLKAYVQEPDEDERVMICDTLEAFYQKSGVFSSTRLPILQESEILKDTATACYKFYQDAFVHITSTGHTPQPYTELPQLVWHDRIQPRPYFVKKGGRYIEFLDKAIGISEHTLNVIGYLSHEYKDEASGYIIVLTEQCPDPKDGGGSGKNLFCNLFKLNTSYISRPGAQTKFDEKFFQVWDGQKIFAISDVPKDFDFIFLKEPSTGSGIMKKLYKDERAIDVEDMPKFVVQTNYSYETSDGGLARRIIPIEFTNFFTTNGGVSEYFGNCHFPKSWNEDDWSGYDYTVLIAISMWLSSGRKLSPVPLSAGGWHKQMEMAYGVSVMGFIEEYFEQWASRGYITSIDFKTQLTNYFQDQNIKYQPGIQKINKAIKDYCDHNNYIFLPNHTVRIGLDTHKCKTFSLLAPF